MAPYNTTHKQSINLKFTCNKQSHGKFYHAIYVLTTYLNLVGLVSNTKIIITFAKKVARPVIALA